MQPAIYRRSSLTEATELHLFGVSYTSLTHAVGSQLQSCSTATVSRHAHVNLGCAHAVHMDSTLSGGSISYSGMKRPSLANLGSMKRQRHVQFVHNDDLQKAQTAGVFNRLLAFFSPLGPVMRRLDELRVILCLYELIMLPLRLAFGTGYGFLAGPRYMLLQQNFALEVQGCNPQPSCLQAMAITQDGRVHGGCCSPERNKGPCSRND